VDLDAFRAPTNGANDGKCAARDCPQGVKSSRAGRPTTTAEVPQEADGIAAAQRTGNECQ
jgi:hypothetical protein